MNAATLALIVAAAFAILAVVALAWALMERRRATAAEAKAWGLHEQFTTADARVRMLEDQSGATAELLKAQATQQAGAVAEELLKRTEESFRNRELVAQERIANQLKPVADTLAKFEAQVTAVEKARAEEQGGLKAQIAALMEASVATQAEAKKLTNALRRGAGVQGRWGEQTLRNVLETAGLAHQYDFVEQLTLDTDEGRRRPDAVVRMPGGAVFVIDAKCSMNAYMDAQDATDDQAREAALTRHVQSLRGHVTGLSAKAYWDQFKGQKSPDFVAMFVMSESILSAALDRAPELLSDAMEKRVLIVTPTTLFALCKAVAYGWRVEEQSANAEHIAALGRELYTRLSVMGGHVEDLGESLKAAVTRYNRFIGSLEAKVLTQARRFEDLKVDHQGKDIPVLEPIETAPRALEKLIVSDTPPQLDAQVSRPYLRLMAVRRILTVDNAADLAVLKKKSAPVETVTDEHRALMDDMLETMYAAPGIGLAAVQVGEPLRIIVMDLAREGEDPAPRYFINPEIVEKNDNLAPYEEGCLSVPDIYETVERPDQVHIRYLDYNGNAIEEAADGLYAVCIQHEMDHLEGVLFIDHLSRLKRDRAITKVKKAARAA
eukprot:gene13415-13191_t